MSQQVTGEILKVEPVAEVGCVYLWGWFKGKSKDTTERSEIQSSMKLVKHEQNRQQNDETAPQFIPFQSKGGQV